MLAGTSTTDFTTDAAVFKHSVTFHAVISAARYSSVNSSSVMSCVILGVILCVRLFVN